MRRVSVLLWDIESDMNLGLAIRDCYVLGDGRIDLYIFDPSDVLSVKAETVRRFSSYAMDHCLGLRVLRAYEDGISLVRHHHGRVVCAVPEENATTDLSNFRFCADDLLVFGNEYHGLPDEVSALANHRIVIPMFGRPYARPDLAGKLTRVGSQRCLGVSASLSIILYIALNQTTNHKDWRLSA